MKNILLSLIILLTSINIMAQESKKNSEELQKNLIISKVLYGERVLDEELFNKFKFNKDKNARLKGLLNRDLNIKLEMWRSVKLSYRYRIDIKTDALSRYLVEYKVEEILKSQINNLIIHAMFREDLIINDENKIVLNIMTIDNMIQKYKDSLRILDYLFSNKYTLKSPIKLNNKVTNYDFYMNSGFELREDKLTKIYSGKLKGSLYSIQIQKSDSIITDKNLKQCVESDAYRFFQKSVIAPSIIKKNHYYEYEGKSSKDKILYTKCATNDKKNKLYRYMFFGLKSHLTEIQNQEK